MENISSKLIIHYLYDKLEELLKKTQDYYQHIQLSYHNKQTENNTPEERDAFVNRERMFLIRFFNEIPHRDRIQYLKKWYAYRAYQWEVLRNANNSIVSFQLDDLNKIQKYLKKSLLYYEPGMYDYFKESFQKKYHWNHLIDATVPIIWVFRKYHEFLEDEAVKISLAEGGLFHWDEMEYEMPQSSHSYSQLFPEIMGLSELARYLSLPVARVYRLVRNNKIPFIQSEGLYYFRQAEIRKWIESGQKADSNAYNSQNP